MPTSYRANLRRLLNGAQAGRPPARVEHGKERARPRRSFTPQFKAEIVELCRRGDRTVESPYTRRRVNQHREPLWSRHQPAIGAGSPERGMQLDLGIAVLDRRGAGWSTTSRSAARSLVSITVCLASRHTWRRRSRRVGDRRGGEWTPASGQRLEGRPDDLGQAASARNSVDTAPGSAGPRSGMVSARAGSRSATAVRRPP